MSHSTLMIERQQIWFKREDLNTTGSIKDRGISHQLNTHLNKNEKSLVISSSGNAAISASYYAKLANAKMYVFIYPDCNPEKKNRLNELGATIMESTQPLTESLEFAERNGFTHIRQATDPEATVGYQELAAEIVDQLGLEKMDINDLALFIPVSSGTAFVGLFEGFSSLIKAKKLEKYPQMHAVQSQAVHPIAGPFDTMFKRKSTSIVDAIVPPWDPPRLETVSQIINQTQGSGWVVQDTDVLQEQEWLQKNEIETSNEGALALAGYRKASKYHQLSTTPIILLTGTKYKKRMNQQIPTFYLTNDPLRALGYENQLQNFHIICIDYTDVVDQVRKAGISIVCFEKDIGVQNELPRNTRMLISHPEVQKYILDNSTSDVNILMFKPNFSLVHALKNSPLAQQRTLHSLNNLPSLTTKLENKFFFKNLCEEHQFPTIPSQQIDLHSLSYNQVSEAIAPHFVIQFDRGWFGNHTFFISSAEDLKKIQEKYTDREVKVAPYITGTTLTNNAVVRDGVTYQSYPFLQINDVPGADIPLARLQGSTIGNAWVSAEKLPVSDPDSVINEIQAITEKIGNRIFELGYKGYFGLDFIVDTQNHVFVQEINARFTASTQMYTYLELDAFQDSLYRQHLAAFDTNVITEKFSENNFQPFSACRILARHTQTQPAILDHSLRNGKYVLEHGTVTYAGEEYDIRKLKNDEILVFTAASGREVTVDQEILQIQSRFHNVEEIISLTRRLKSQIDLSPIH